MKRIAIFASGSGTNAENIANYFSNRDDVEISLILANNKDAFVLERAKKFEIPTMVFNRQDFYETEVVLYALKNRKIDLVVLAGFLWLIPDNLIGEFPHRIINIHPALLPRFGGKGMYGSRVHKAVIEAKEEKTGISIHYVNEKYDEGEIIFQESFQIKSDDTPDDIAAKVHELEYEYFPKVIEKLLDEL
jgi:phosphoribosylglycinamide formyltransferase-1